jgi:8-oxo-dGTP pyrophosphatase MutT (NUDIX family)
MAFPGGHRDPDDGNLRAAAIRETREEIGLDLGNANYLGALDHQQALPAARPLKMVIAPHVFELCGNPSVAINHEVAEVVWTGIAPLISGEWHDTETRPLLTGPTTFSGYRLERGHFVWGLTYRMLKSLFSAMDPNWEPPPES